MSIYIQDMNLPQKGGYIDVRIFADGWAHEATAEPPLYNRAYEAIELPPHGRLGDLDALESNLRHMAKYQHGERQQGILGCCSTICSAPTIIPAEGGADG